jgi:hypothetical protein
MITMTRRTMWLTALATLLFGSTVTGGIASAKTSLLVDGSFERPVLETGTVSRDFAAGQHVGAWQVAAGSVVLSAAIPPVETPPLGSQVMNLRPAPVPGPGDGEICQTVTGMNPSAVYKIRFLAASVVGDSTIDVTFGGSNVAHFDVPASFPAQFEQYVRTVTAPSSSAVLCLHGHPVGEGSVPLVDAVRIKPQV